MMVKQIKEAYSRPDLTAIKRFKLSSPMNKLNKQGLLIGDVLDYGCGKGFDADCLGFDKYDPFYFPDLMRIFKYDTITCHYVLNVIREDQVQDVIEDILSLLKPGGKAYISFRNDLKYNTRTQRIVSLEAELGHYNPLILTRVGYTMVEIKREVQNEN